MKFCPECRRPIPDGLLVCIACVTRKSDEAMRRYQVDALRRLVRDGGSFLTVAQQGVRHLKQFGADKTFCGRDVGSHDRRGRIDPQLEELTGVCANCRVEVERVLQEARA